MGGGRWAKVVTDEWQSVPKRTFFPDELTHPSRFSKTSMGGIEIGQVTHKRCRITSYTGPPIRYRDIWPKLPIPDPQTVIIPAPPPVQGAGRCIYVTWPNWAPPSSHLHFLLDFFDMPLHGKKWYFFERQKNLLSKNHIFLR